MPNRTSIFCNGINQGLLAKLHSTIQVQKTLRLWNLKIVWQYARVPCCIARHYRLRLISKVLRFGQCPISKELDIFPCNVLKSLWFTHTPCFLLYFQQTQQSIEHFNRPLCTNRNKSAKNAKISTFHLSKGKYLNIQLLELQYICCNLDQASHIVTDSYIAETFRQQLHRGI